MRALELAHELSYRRINDFTELSTVPVTAYIIEQILEMIWNHIQKNVFRIFPGMFDLGEILSNTCSQKNYRII